MNSAPAATDLTAVPTEIADRTVFDRAVDRLRQTGLRLPTFAELTEPTRLPDHLAARLVATDPDAPDAGNLLRLHWFNAADRRSRVPVPGYLALPAALTGCPAPILVALGRRFPMIGAHKVLAAYACLVSRLVTGHFDPTRHRAIWPSTGNYCRGGVAISRLLGCRGVAVLPEGMSRERFAWLERWVTDPADIIRTPGTESNVKEIYDACADLEREPDTVILNQFSEFANHLVHYAVTGHALERVFRDYATQRTAIGAPEPSAAAFVAGTGSAGTLGAGDYLKETLGARVVAVEPVECPTLLYNGYGAHNIQGIGDKHVPLIHNVMNTDLVVGVSDRATDHLDLLFNDPEGIAYLTERRGLPGSLVSALPALGFSGIANVLAAIKTARRLDLGEDDVILTVATDGAELYDSERANTRGRDFPEGFDRIAAAEVFGQHLAGIDGDHVLETTHRDRRRIFNLGYYTWVEQQGVTADDFDRRRQQGFWRGLRTALPVWDALITDVNRRTGLDRDA